MEQYRSAGNLILNGIVGMVLCKFQGYESVS